MDFNLIAENGKTFNLRTCEGGDDAKLKVGTCEDRQITLKAAGTKNVRTCYCGDDLCNGTSQINPSFLSLASLVVAIFMMLKIQY